jgi:hypothetical protein
MATDQETDNKRTAVEMAVTLSTSLMSASLAIIAIEIGFATFILDKRIIGLWFYVFLCLSFLLFVLSIFFGGKGVDIARKSGHKGNWNLESGKKQFNLQSWSSLAGLFFFFLIIFQGEPAEDAYLRELRTMNAGLSKRDSTFVSQLDIQRDLSQLRAAIDSINANLRRTNHELQRLQGRKQ